MNHPEVCPHFTLLVAGSPGGKTSFLRLVLDTSDIAPSNSKDQLAAVAKFVQGSSGHTSFFRTTSVDIDLDPGRPVALNLIDSPSLDFRDDAATDRIIAETLRVIDNRFMEGLEDDRKAHTGDRYVHLCIYFLDPDTIVPPSVRPPAPPVPRARTNSFSQPEQEPVILELPVTTNPSMVRPTLPAADIATIRQLSARVNVLPVIARADTLSNERLAAVKLAVRHDLADAGIGFGIFDVDNHPLPHYPVALPPSQAAAASSASNTPSVHSPEDSKLTIPVDPLSSNGSNGYGGTTTSHLNGGSTSTASAATSPPTSPASSSMLRLPYALVSPDIYSHSEGVARIPPSRHELVQQYTPTSTKTSRRGRFLRHYRWGVLDVLDPAHSDFVPLRNAIFHHMETLQKYTREYLFEKFRSDYIQQQQQQQPRPSSRHSTHPTPHTHSLSHPHPHPHSHSPHAISHLTHPHPLGHMPGLASHSARPILAIDTQPPPQHSSQGPHHPQPHSSIGRHSQQIPIPTSSRDLMSAVDGRTPGSSAGTRSAGLGSSAIAAPGDSPVASGSGRSGPSRPGQLNPANKTRSKKINVACNFCRSRKLKCDGGRPACGQCLKRSNPCDYAPQNKRRNTLRQARRSDITPSRPGDDDDDNSTGGDYNRGESGNEDGRSEVSLSPEVHALPLTSAGSVSAPISRRGSNLDKREREAGYVTHHSLPPILGRDELAVPSRAPPPHQHQPPPPLHHHSDRDPHPRHLREREPPLPSSHQNPLPLPSQLPPRGGGSSGRPFFPDNELPHIATLSLPDRSSPSTPGPMSAPSLPPIRPASEHQAALRKRAATVPGKTGSGRGSGTGPKVVACNSCRARKTKCDGAHPACASCARRQVTCLYVHDVNGNASRDPSSNAASSLKKRRASAAQQHQRQQLQPSTRQGGYPPSTKEDDDSPRSLSPPSSRMLMTPSTASTGPTGGVDLLDRRPGLHRSYQSFHSTSDDGLDDRDDRISDSRESLRGERDGRDVEMDLKRPLPMEHLDRDVEMRSSHDDIDMRAVKKMRMEEGRTVAPAGIP